MSEKIAVRCETETEWNRIGKIAGYERPWKLCKEDYPSDNICINIDEGLWSNEPFYLKAGYTIISAEEYLKEPEFKDWTDGADFNAGDIITIGGSDKRFTIKPCKTKEGGNEVTEFKVGDRVECVDASGERHEHVLSVDNIYTVTYCSDIFLKLEGFKENTYRKERFKLATNKPIIKTTKEATMNKNIAKVYEKTTDAVLVEKYHGDTIDESFYDYVILSAHAGEFLKEAKRLDKEAEKDCKSSK